MGPPAKRRQGVVACRCEKWRVRARRVIGEHRLEAALPNLSGRARRAAPPRPIRGGPPAPDAAWGGAGMRANRCRRGTRGAPWLAKHRQGAALDAAWGGAGLVAPPVRGQGRTATAPLGKPTPVPAFCHRQSRHGWSPPESRPRSHLTRFGRPVPQQRLIQPARSDLAHDRKERRRK